MKTGIKGKRGVRLVWVMQLVITPAVLYVIWISHQNSHGLERWTQWGYRPGTEPARRPLAGGGQSGHFEHGCHPRVPASGHQVSKRHEGEMLGAVILSKGFWWQTSCRELSSAAAQRAAGPGSRRAAHSCGVPRADKAAPAPALLLPAWHGWQCWMDHGPDTLRLSHHLQTRKTELKGKKKKKELLLVVTLAEQPEVMKSVFVVMHHYGQTGVKLHQRVEPTFACPVVGVAGIPCCLKHNFNSQHVPLLFYGSFSSCPAL